MHLETRCFFRRGRQHQHPARSSTRNTVAACHRPPFAVATRRAVSSTAILTRRHAGGFISERAGAKLVRSLDLRRPLVRPATSGPSPNSVRHRRFVAACPWTQGASVIPIDVMRDRRPHSAIDSARNGMFATLRCLAVISTFHAACSFSSLRISSRITRWANATASSSPANTAAPSFCDLLFGSKNLNR